MNSRTVLAATFAGLTYASGALAQSPATQPGPPPMTLLTTLTGHAKNVLSAAFSADGSRIVTGSDDKTARVWDASTGKTLAVLSGHSSSVNAAQFSPDGSRIVTGSMDDTARLWNAQTFALMATLKQTDSVQIAQFSPDGSKLATNFGNSARLWNGMTGAPIAVLSHTAYVDDVAFSPDGRRIVTASHDNTVRVWDSTSGAPLETLAMGSGNLMLAAVFSPDGRVIAARDWNPSVPPAPSGVTVVKLWDAGSLALIATLSCPVTVATNWPLSPSSFSPDGGRILIGCNDGTARVFDTKTGAMMTTYQIFSQQDAQKLVGHDIDQIRDLPFSPNGKLILTPTLANEVLRDSTTFAEIASASVPQTPSSLPPAIQGIPGVVPSIRTIPGITTIDFLSFSAFSPDSARIVGVSGHEGRVWKVPGP